jgi:hypothetical protein
VVAGVEVSADGGTHWHPATLTGADGPSVGWSYRWVAHGYPSTVLESRAVDDSGNLETPSDALTVTVACPCSIWGRAVKPPRPLDSGDSNSVELGVKFQSDVSGHVTGIRFYKAAANTGTHIGSLWTSGGSLLASATFTNETASGWQTLKFATPVAIQANTTYVAGYFDPAGHYTATDSYFYPQPAPTPLGGAIDARPPVQAVPTATSANGVYTYSTVSVFPTHTFSASNYWVDVLFAPS